MKNSVSRGSEHETQSNVSLPETMHMIVMQTSMCNLRVEDHI